MSSRRGKGEGSIFQRSDGRWAGTVSAGWTSTGRTRHTAYGKTRAEAAIALRRLQHQLSQGLPVVDERTTVAVFLEGWLERVAPRLRPATLLRYRGLVRGQLIPHLGRIRLANLSPADVSKMLAALQAQGLSPRTASHARAVLRAALSDGEKWALVARNVAKLTDAVKVPAPSPKMLPIEDVHLVLDAVRGTDVANEVTLALYSGMRMGEVLGLRWSDVAFEADQLTVARALQRLGSETHLVEPKSASSHRTLQLPAPAVEALRAERQSQVERQLAAGSRWRQPIVGLVFTDATGGPLVPTTVTRAFVRALRRAGLPPLRFHHLRHLHAGLMLGSGADIATVSHLLGHSSVALTASTYAGIMPALKREAAERFERLLSRPG
jgi:integrase